MQHVLSILVIMTIQSAMAMVFEIGDRVQVSDINMEDKNQVGTVIKVIEARAVSKMYLVFLDNGNKVTQEGGALFKVFDARCVTCTERAVSFNKGDFVEVIQPHVWAGLKGPIMHCGTTVVSKEKPAIQVVYLDGRRTVGADVEARPLAFRISSIQKCAPFALPQDLDDPDSESESVVSWAQWERVAEEVDDWEEVSTKAQGDDEDWVDAGWAQEKDAVQNLQGDEGIARSLWEQEDTAFFHESNVFEK